jgi:hypothetical protein
LSGTAEHDSSSRHAPPPKARGDGARRIGDLWQWLGISGAVSGPNGVTRRTFFYGYGVAAVMVGIFCVIEVITVRHEQPQFGLGAPILWESSSWVTYMLFFGLIWTGHRLAPLLRLRWRLLVHLPLAVLFSLAHVGGFVLLRKLVCALAGLHYEFGSFFPHFGYELSKDSIGYVGFLATFGLIEHLLRQQTLIDAPGQSLTFDIRDGAKLIRVQLDQVLAVSSAGNYVEFVMLDGRRLLMRSPLSAMESALEPRGFLRTHRSWLVNAARMTALKPEGSGDYAIELGSLTVPLSRRFPEALAKLRGG